MATMMAIVFMSKIEIVSRGKFNHFTAKSIFFTNYSKNFNEKREEIVNKMAASLILSKM